MARIRFSSKKPKLVDVLIYDSVGSENIKASLGYRTKWGIIEARDINLRRILNNEESSNFNINYSK